MKCSGCRCSSPAAEASASTSGDVLAVKQELLAAIEGTDRGIGGVQVLCPTAMACTLYLGVSLSWQPMSRGNQSNQCSAILAC